MKCNLLALEVQRDRLEAFVATLLENADFEPFVDQKEDERGRKEGGGNLLDVGAGEGDHVIHYGRRFPNAHVVGLEIDAARAEVAWQKVTGGGLAGRVEIRQGDANQLEEKNSYDWVTLSHHLPPAAGMTEILLEHLASARCATPFLDPDQAVLEKMSEGNARG